MNRSLLFFGVWSAMCSAASLPAADVVTLFDGRTARVADALVEAEQLFIPLDAAAEVTGFDIKPSGACRGELCFPLRRQGADAVIVERQGRSYLALSKWAEQLEQVAVYDDQQQVWSFGEIPQAVQAGLLSGAAPDFTLPDRNGKPVRLAKIKNENQT